MTRHLPGFAALSAAQVITRRIRLEEAVGSGFDALLYPAGAQLKNLIDLPG